MDSYFDRVTWLTEQRKAIDGNLNFNKTVDKIYHYNIA